MKKRRKRQLGIDAAIRAKAREIYESGMAEAMRAAALMIVARKQDEIIAILRGAGLQGVAQQLVSPVYNQPPAQVAKPPMEHPCCQCGREGVKRTRPNRFNPTGSWYCKVHLPLANTVEIEDRIDNAILGQQAAPIPKKPVLVQTNAPMVMRKTEETPVADAPADPMAEAMANAEVVQ